MRKIVLTILLLTGCFFTKHSQAQSPVKDYLSAPGPINFNNVAYNLVWTSQPSSNYFKQEYIASGDSVEKFRELILIEFIEGDFTAKQALAAKVSELNEMKKTNPVVNYDIIKNKETGEYMIDFLVSKNSPNGRSIEIAERNVYRYKKVEDSKGHKGVLLFAVSVRSYGDHIIDFLNGLKEKRDDLINQVSQFDLPKIEVAN